LFWVSLLHKTGKMKR